MQRTVRPDTAPVSADGSLSRLLETEARLAERLAAAEAEAARIRAAAGEAARTAGTAFESELAAAVTALDADYARRQATRLTEIDAERSRRTNALQALPATVISGLADEVVERLLQATTRDTP
jgi:hypothetical protein